MNIPMLLPFLQALTDKWTGGLRVAMRDRHGHEPDVSGYGQLLTGMYKDDILVKFAFSNSTEDVVITTTGTGATSNNQGRGIVSTGAGVGTARMRSRRRTNYRPAHDMHAVGSWYFPSTNIDSDTYQYGGLFSGTNGLAFGRQGTQFGILYRNNSVDTFVAQSNWNGDKCDGTGLSSFNIDPTKLHQYRFLFGFLGIAPIICQVFGGNGVGWVTCHVFDFTNSQDTLTFSNPGFPMAVEVGRTAGTGEVTAGSASWNAGVTEGSHSHAGHRIFGAAITTTLVAGVETYIGTFENKLTYQGLDNSVQIEATFMSFSTDGTKNVLFKGYTGMTLSTSYNPVDVNTDNSVTAVDQSSTSFSGGKFEFPVAMAKVDQAEIDVGSGHFHLELFPGERFTLTATSAAASEITFACRWEEYFS